MTRTRKVGVAALLAAALAAFTALLPGTALAADAPDAPERSALTAENSGDVAIEKSGSRATVQTGVERAYVYVYPEGADPVSVAWQQTEGGSFAVDLSLMPAGEVTIVLLDADGQILGWGSTALAAEESHAPPPDEAEAGTDPADLPLWPWMGGGLLLLGLVGAYVFVLQRRRGGARTDEAAPPEEERESDD